jgi:Rieske Fe-S protein
MSDFALSRRGVVRGSVVTVVGGVAGYLLARGSAAARMPAGTTAANAYGAPAGTGRRLLAPLDSVPRGGGLIVKDPPVVLTRTAADDVHAFSAVCTHQGCTVATVAGGTIDCPCHGSRFDAATGAVRTGPATSPLPQVAVVVQGGQVYTA